MAAEFFDSKMYHRELIFCKIYSKESKEKLEKLFLKNRISYYTEWQDKSFLKRLLTNDRSNEKSVYVVRINEADVERAKALIEGIDDIKLCIEEINS